MAYAASLLLLAVALFVSTNLDDLFVLVGFLASPSFRKRDVVIGQLLGTAILTIGSMALAATTVVVPKEIVGLLGIAPVVIGVKAFRGALRESPDDASQALHPRTGILAVALVAAANGGDNVAVYVPVFATHRQHALAVFGVVFLVMTVGYCWVAHFLVNHRRVGAPVRRYAGRLLPWLLVVIGLEVMWSAGLVDWVGRRFALT